MHDFGHQLRDLRNRLGLTQGDLAKASRLAQSTISALETGRQSPWPSTRRALARAVRLTLPEFDAQTMLNGPGPAPEAGQSPHDMSTPGTSNLRAADSLQRADLAGTVLRLVERLHAAEDRLRQTEHQLSLVQRALEQAHVVMWTTDTELRMRSVHGGNSEILGKPQDVLGTRLDQCFCGVAGAPDSPLEAHQRALAGAATRSTVQCNGQMFNLIVEPQHDADGRVIGTVGVAVEVPRGEKRQSTP